MEENYQDKNLIYFVGVLRGSVMSDSLWPHRRKTVRLLCLWNLLVTNNGVGCHFLLQWSSFWPMDWTHISCIGMKILYYLSYLGFILSLLERVAVPFSRGSSQPRNQTQVSCTEGRFFTSWATKESQTEQSSIDILLKKQNIDYKLPCLNGTLSFSKVKIRNGIKIKWELFSIRVS